MNVRSVTEMYPSDIAKMHRERRLPTWIVYQAYEKAIDDAWANLARYKFSNFGYHAARVVFLAHLLESMGVKKRPNPFRRLVVVAREVRAEFER